MAPSEAPSSSVVATSGQQHSGSNFTESTIPLSSGVVERYLDIRRREAAKKKHSQGNSIQSLSVPARSSQIIPITQLRTDELLCRLLIIPESGILDVSGGEWIHVPGSVHTEESSHAPVQCLAVFQRQQDISCEITSPIHCELYYDSREDAVLITNGSEAPFSVKALIEQE